MQTAHEKFDFALATGDIREQQHIDQFASILTHCHPPTHTNTAAMGGVSVRDVQADKFIEAYAAFLKRQGKLPIPGP